MEKILAIIFLRTILKTYQFKQRDLHPAYRQYFKKRTIQQAVLQETGESMLIFARQESKEGMCMEQNTEQNLFGKLREWQEIMDEIESDEEMNLLFQGLTEQLQEELLEFCMGSRGAKVTYDPFFKFVFNPERNPDRLSELLSLILGEEVTVIAAIPNESTRITEEGSLLITDILVKLKSGAYANVEIQKVGYAFPGQRCACYSSDLLLRQLARLKIEAKQNGQPFSYRMIKKVYTIVFMENSTAMYKDFPNVYIHRAKQTFDTELQMDLLQEYVVIPLDIFRKMHHTELSKLEAWLYLISSDEPQDIYRVMEHYPEFKVIYKELAQLRNHMKELIIMYDSYRQMLAELDKNTTRLMVEELTQEVETLTQANVEKDHLIEKQQEELDRLRKMLAQ